VKFDSAIEKAHSLLKKVLCLSWVWGSHSARYSDIIVAAKTQLSKHAEFL